MKIIISFLAISYLTCTTVCLSQQAVLGYEKEYSLLLKSGARAARKAHISNSIDTTIVVFDSDLGCDAMGLDFQLNYQTSFKDIGFAFYEVNKCGRRKVKQISAEIYYLDKNRILLGYFDGHKLILNKLKNGRAMYPELQKLLSFVIKNEITSLYNLGCIDAQLYYGERLNSDSLLIDVSDLYRGGELEIKYIKDLD